MPRAVHPNAARIVSPAEACQRLGWLEAGGFEVRQGEDGAAVLCGFVGTHAAKIVPGDDGGFTLFVDRKSRMAPPEQLKRDRAPRVIPTPDLARSLVE